MTLAEDLSDRTLRRVVDAVGAVELVAADGGPFLRATNDEAGTSGVLRVFSSPTIPKIATTVLSVPARGVVTCMIFAFAPAGSALPHFTLDCSDRPDGQAFHLDLVTRVDLATHVAYMDEVFTPLTAAYDAAAAIEGLSRTSTSRRQYAMMSPWMLVHLADEAAFRAIDPVVEAYTDHWISLVTNGLSAPVTASVADTDLAARDDALRTSFFSPDLDPVWGRVGAMLGDQVAGRIRAELVTNDCSSAPGNVPIN